MESRRSTVVSVPAPIGGWNTRDPLQDMPSEDAVVLTNWFPNTGSVDTRGGHSEHATGMTGSVQTLAEYHSGSTRTLIAAANGNIWDATLAASATSLASGFSNNRWQTANFNGSMGLVNGTDAPQVFDGATVTAMTVSGSGLTTTSLVGIGAHKNRTYFWENDSQDFWYSAVNALGGALTKFPLSRVHQFGGNLVCFGSWTLDAGDGVDDLAVFIMSSGDAIVYQGSDPGSSTDWSLVGIYRIGAPLSVRSIAKLGGDLIITTRDDYVSLNEVIHRDRSTVKKSKAVGALKEAVSRYASQFGWQITVYPKGSMLICNVPTTSSVFEQHVMNTITGAWTKFSGWDAFCFCVFNNDLYFGGAGGIVYKADTGTSDDNSAINFDAQTAWSSLRTSRTKQLAAVRNYISTDAAGLTVTTAIGADFSDPTAGYSVSANDNIQTPWDTSTWDTAEWPIENFVYADWQSVGDVGRYFSQRVRISTGVQSASWHSTDYLVQPGGLL